MPVSEKRQVSKHLPHTFPEAADLYEAGLDGEPQSHGDQQDHQDVVRQIRVDGVYDVQQHVSPSLFPARDTA